MKAKTIFCAAFVSTLMVASTPALAKKKKDKPKKEEPAQTQTVAPTATENAAAQSLPEGVRNIPGLGLCRERPAKEPSRPMTVVAPRPRQRAKGSIEGKVSVMAGGKAAGDNANVVVYVEGVPGQRPPAGKNHPQVFQRDLSFVPEVNVVTVGTTMDFPNEDRVFHNIFSVSEPAKFDLGLYKAGESRSFTFSKPGDVDVYCNIHPQMISKIKVLDTRFYAITGKDGKFRIEDVPEGKYRILAWHAFADETQDEVEVKGNSTTEHDLGVKMGRGATSHLRKDGTPYGRYK